MSSLLIVGTGLIGGSLGLALKAAGYAGEIVGFDRADVLDEAERRGAIDRGARELEPACAQAALIMLALPVGAILDALPRVVAAAAAGALISDTGSTKQRIHEAVETALRRRPRAADAAPVFIGGHPMAGREQGGIAQASGELFRGTRWLLSAHPAQPEPASAAPLLELIRLVGAIPMWLDAALHDETLAWLSHVPQLLSTLLAAELEREFIADGRTELLSAAGAGVRDMTRLAASPYQLWRDILHTNGTAIEAALLQLEQGLEALRSSLRSRDTQELFERAGVLYRQLRRQDP